jgi:hypothetical protein
MRSSSGRRACRVRELGLGRPDSTRREPAPADTGRRDSVRADSVRADSVRRAAVSDSTQRDSIIARQLRAVRRRGDRVAGPLTLDRLRVNAVGASAGMAMPDQVQATTVYSVHADYGEVARDVAVIFGLMVWSSAYRDAAVDAFARSIAAATANGGSPATITFGRVRASDVALHADLRWRPRTFRGWRPPGAIRPWGSAGGAVHLLDVQGAPITDTFVERSLDGVAFGIAGALGADLLLAQTLQVTGQLRYDLFNGAHFASARAGVSYVLDRRRR